MYISISCSLARSGVKAKRGVEFVWGALKRYFAPGESYARYATAAYPAVAGACSSL